jgi:plasmid stabilization system protein ParE
MTPRFVLTLRPEADEDVRAAAMWYDTERPGLGTEFTRAAGALFASLEREPLLSPIAEGDVRRALLRRFPYAVYFTVDAEGVLVLACLHVRRDPHEWQRRR